MILPFSEYVDTNLCSPTCRPHSNAENANRDRETHCGLFSSARRRRAFAFVRAGSDPSFRAASVFARAITAWRSAYSLAVDSFWAYNSR